MERSIQTREAYDKWAKRYDLYVQLYRLFGLRISAYRTRAVELLHLRPGAKVVELGCGTGLNFSRIMDRIGPDGCLIGIDISSGMLQCAHERVKRAGWENVELVQADLDTYEIPNGIDAVLATGVFGYIDNRESIIETIAAALTPGGHLAIFDGKRPQRMPSWMFRFFLLVSRPFGVTQEYLMARTWECVERHFVATQFEEYYWGLLYISSGERPANVA
jgi:demethylmenaquinone methyltransferase/2-methoxy-6-polyprenyl-1,4-benzoquinol methylase